MFYRPTIIPDECSAFSLVELSIVLVILGLLSGGILTGQSLIKAAELRAVTTEFNNIQTAVIVFKNKYFSLPGDMDNATLFWGKLSAHCNSDAGAAQTNGTCNGNADGVFSDAAGGSQEGEIFTFWQHLSLAGLIEGQYTGISGTANGQHSNIGQNVPASKYSGGGWHVELPNTWGNTMRYQHDYGNSLKIGANQVDNEPENPLFTPEEAWNIDKKIDDGKPGRGKVIARYWDNCTDSASNTDLDGNYLLSEKTVQCAFYIKDILR